MARRLDLTGAVAVDFPLRGEWVAVNTPARRVPSHGTDYLGQRYAYDFARLHATRHTYYERGVVRHLFGLKPASEFLCWDEPVHAAFSGQVVAAADGGPDRERVNVFVELLRGFVPIRVKAPDYRPLAGNYAIVEGEPGVALYAHLRNGSVRVRVGEQVARGGLLGNVGNSGNSTMPHLHFHLMKPAEDWERAEGVLCAFREYERFADGRWERVERGVPGDAERIRATR